MRVILIGQAAFAEKVFDGLRDRGHDVRAVYCPPDRPSAKPDPVKSRAEAVGIPVRQHKSLRGPEVQREFAELRADLGVLAYVTQIVPQNIIETPKLGCICFHPSLLPLYRGGSAIPWQIIKGETRSGVTVFWTDPGIDTGPILLQKEARIDPDDTAATLYYNTLFPLGVEAVLESVDLVAVGNPPSIPQDHSKGTYDPLCTDDHACIDWTRPVAEVYNLIRGCDPQPGAFVPFRGGKLRFHDARRVDGSAQPGTIVSVSDDGILVGASGGVIRAARLRFGDRKASALEIARELELVPGATV